MDVGYPTNKPLNQYNDRDLVSIEHSLPAQYGTGHWEVRIVCNCGERSGFEKKLCSGSVLANERPISNGNGAASRKRDGRGTYHHFVITAQEFFLGTSKLYICS